MYARAHDLFCFSSLEILITYTRLLFLPYKSWRLIQPIIRTQVEDKYVLVRVYSRFGDLAHNGMFATVDRLVLIVHDRSCANGSVVTQVTSKARDGRYDNDNSEFAALFCCPDGCIDH